MTPIPSPVHRYYPAIDWRRDFKLLRYGLFFKHLFYFTLFRFTYTLLCSSILLNSVFFVSFILLISPKLLKYLYTFYIKRIQVSIKTSSICGSKIESFNHVKRTWFSLSDRAVILQLFTGDILLLIDPEIFGCCLTGHAHYIPPSTTSSLMVYTTVPSCYEQPRTVRKQGIDFFLLYFYAYLSGSSVFHHVVLLSFVIN